MCIYTPNSSFKSILLVDDDPLIRKLVKQKLSDSDSCVISVPTIQEAELSLYEHDFTHMFIDNELGPGHPKGVSLVHSIRTRRKKAIICMLTGDNSTDILLEALLAGANDYIWKGAMNPGPLVQMKHILTKSWVDYSKANNFSAQSILRTRGLCDSQLDLLEQYANNGFPDLYVLADIMNVSENALVKRFSRIEKTLGLKNRAGLVQLLTICSGYGRMRL